MDCGRHRLGRFVGVRVGVSYSRYKLALRTRLRNLNLMSQFYIFRNLNQKSQFSIFDIFRDIRVHIYDFLKFVGSLWALKWACQSIGIDENNTFHLKVLF